MVKKRQQFRCPYCGSENISKNGHNKTGKQVYRCNNPECSHYSFVEEYTYNAYKPEVRLKVLELTVNGTGTRAAARVLNIAKGSVTTIKKTEDWIWQVNYNNNIYDHQVEQIDVFVTSLDQIEVNEAEMDEMWSFVHDRSQQYWL